MIFIDPVIDPGISDTPGTRPIFLPTPRGHGQLFFCDPTPRGHGQVFDIICPTPRGHGRIRVFAAAARRTPQGTHCGSLKPLLEPFQTSCLGNNFFFRLIVVVF